MNTPTLLCTSLTHVLHILMKREEMDLLKLCIEGAFVIQGGDITDERGNFREIFHSGKLSKELQLTQIHQVSEQNSFLYISCLCLGKCIL